MRYIVFVSFAQTWQLVLRMSLSFFVRDQSMMFGLVSFLIKLSSSGSGWTLVRVSSTSTDFQAPPGIISIRKMMISVETQLKEAAYWPNGYQAIQRFACRLPLNSTIPRQAETLFNWMPVRPHSQNSSSELTLYASQSNYSLLLWSYTRCR